MTREERTWLEEFAEMLENDQDLAHTAEGKQILKNLYSDITEFLADTEEE